MSETDDTDVLLLIPPDFFLVQSSESDNSLLESSRTVVHKPPSCTAQVLGKLVDQVHTLESRLETLELSTASDISCATTGSRHKTWDTDSLDSRSLDRKCFTFPRRRRRKVTNRKQKKRDLSLTSLDTVSTDKIPSLELRDNSDITSVGTKLTDNIHDTLSMDGDISSIVSTPSKKNDKLLLHEIDEFLTKVETYESPESKYKAQDTLSPENLIKATGDYISHKLNTKNSGDEVKLPSGRTVPSNILDKYIYLVKNNPQMSQTKDIPSGGSYKNENNPDVTSKNMEGDRNLQGKSPSIRRLNFSETKDVQPTSTPKRLLQPTTSYMDSFRPSSNKIYDRASKVLEQYKAQSYSRTNHNSMTDSYSTSPKRDDFKVPEFRAYTENKLNMMKPTTMEHKLMESIDTDLLSLSELWGEKGERMDKLDNVKLEEERLKREHCEAMIQQLQKKILDQQEKLAVAIKVDRGKDAAIAKLKEAWLKLSNSLDRAEDRHRTALDKMVTEVDNFKMIADEAQKKTNHFEAELYKALDLAHDYQDKCKQLTAAKKEMQDNMDKVSLNKDEVIKARDREVEVLKENYETVMRLNKQSTDCIRNLEDSLEKEKTDHELSKSKTNELNRKLQSANEEMSIIRQERDLLKEKVNEERARCNMLERQLCEKQNQCSDLLKKCDTLDSEVKTLHKHLELQKNELKSHYQKQLEDAVLGKLQEFQQQLERAERELESDARARENNIMDTFNKQVARIEDQHKLEINVLEEKQREEIKLYRLQLAQASEKISLLEGKLESFRRRRGALAAELHGVMEAQWRRALRILTAHEPPPRDITATTASTPVAQDYPLCNIPPLSTPMFAERAVSREGRPPDALNFDALSDHELQQYVKLLLTKPPNLDGSGEHTEHKDINEEPTSDRPEKLERRDRAKRSLNTSKPPWKA